MLPLESKAMDIVSELLKNQEIPMKRVKSMHLEWKTIEGGFFPILHCEFHKEDEHTWMTDFMKS